MFASLRALVSPRTAVDPKNPNHSVGPAMIAVVRWLNAHPGVVVVDSWAGTGWRAPDVVFDGHRWSLGEVAKAVHAFALAEGRVDRVPVLSFLVPRGYADPHYVMTWPTPAALAAFAAFLDPVDPTAVSDKWYAERVGVRPAGDDAPKPLPGSAEEWMANEG